MTNKAQNETKDGYAVDLQRGVSDYLTDKDTWYLIDETEEANFKMATSDERKRLFEQHCDRIKEWRPVYGSCR